MASTISAAVQRALRKSRWTESDARTVLDAVACSALSIAEFARRHPVDPQRLYGWRRRLARRNDGAPRELDFVQVDVPTAAVIAPRYEIRLPSGETLRVEGRVDPAGLAMVLAVLRADHPC